MRNAQLEARTLLIVDMVNAAQHVEDAGVELKATWIEPRKAARRLAAHANAARGEPILWIVGLDEKRGVVGVERNAFADWWIRVQAEFDGLVPSLVDLVVPTGGKTVVALYFDTSRAPFVIANPRAGVGGEVVQREVPWRDGTAVRSATREELLRILVSSGRLPDHEVIDAYVVVDALQFGSDEGQRYRLEWQVGVELYIAPSTLDRVVFPFHHASMTITLGAGDWAFEPPRVFGSAFKLDRIHDLGPMVNATASELIVEGPGRATISTYFGSDWVDLKPQRSAAIALTLRAIGVERPLESVIEVPPRQSSSERRWMWQLHEPEEALARDGRVQAILVVPTKRRTSPS